MFEEQVLAKKKVKKSKQPEFSFLCFKIDKYNAAVDAAINYEVRDLKRRDSEDRVYPVRTSWTDDGILLR
jgi:hypothetical protein